MLTMLHMSIVSRECVLGAAMVRMAGLARSEGQRNAGKPARDKDSRSQSDQSRAKQPTHGASLPRPSRRRSVRKTTQGGNCGRQRACAIPIEAALVGAGLLLSAWKTLGDVF